MRIRYTKTALADIRAACIYITQEVDESVAENVLGRVRSAVESLADFPEQGRSGRVASTRELVVPRTSLIVAYRIVQREVQILALIHSARRWPDTFK